MKTRLMSGTVYIALLVAFYLLKIYVHAFCFDVLIYAFSLIGTFEMVRAMGDRMTKAERGIVYGFAIVCIPSCAIVEQYFRFGLHMVCIAFLALAIALICLLVVRHDETTLENIGVSFLSAVYPSMLLSVLVLTNHVENFGPFARFGFNSDLLILFVFVASPLADSLAYLFGRFLRGVFPRKLAPVLSPNKTVIGAIGGLIGGVLTGIILYFTYNYFAGSFDHMQLWLPVYIAIGFFAALATAFGDLVESCIKRKVGIKDMGKIMPGHGGVLDRIDGTLFAGVAVYLIFALIWRLARLW